MPDSQPSDPGTEEIQQLIGQTLWDVQKFEEALACLIALVYRIPMNASLDESKQILDRLRSATLGRLLKELRAVIVIDESFEPFLKLFLEQRNWLVHDSWRSHREYLSDRQTFIDLRYRVHRLGKDAVEFSQFFGRLISEWAREKGLSADEIEQITEYTYRP